MKIKLLTIILLASLTSFSQTKKMNRASLNESGEISVETVEVPISVNNKSTNGTIEELFSFGRPANPSVKNTRGATLADLDDDGIDEIIYGIDDTLYVLKGDGSILWQKTILGIILLPPAVADLDGDGDLEIVLNTGYPTTVGRVYAMDHNGVDLPGWPLNFSDHWMINAPVIADVNQDGNLDIVTCERAGSTEGYVHVLNLDGSSISTNWPVQLDATPAFTPSVGDIDDDGNNDVVIATSSTGMYAFSNDGSLKTGFPVIDASVRYSYQSPILADLDDDGTLEIIGSNHGDAPGFYVLDHDGTYHTGWPVGIGGWTYSPPTVTDIDGDGDLEIFMADRNTSNDGTPLPTIYGFEPDASALPNFPIEKYGGNEGVLTIADITDDGVPEIIFGSIMTDADGYGYLHAYSVDGSGEVAGFPLRPRGFTFLNGAVVGDVNNDGMMDVTANSYTQTFGAGVDSTFVSTYNLNVAYDAEKIWSNGYKGSNTRDGLVGPSAPLSAEDIIASSFVVNPNPSNGILNIETNRNAVINKIEVYSIEGKQVFSEENIRAAQTNLSYNLNYLKSGLYLLKVYSENKVHTLKWIKN